MNRLLTGTLLGLLLFVGCSSGRDYSDLKLVEVTGEVTLNGQPLPDATVRFEGPPGRFAEGMTDPAGKFRLLYDSTKAGCTPGEKVVRITSGSAGEGSEEGSPIEGADGQVIQQVQTIPAAYNTASKLSANVSPGNQTFRFDLKSTP
jgi:hypothetical protein